MLGIALVGYTWALEQAGIRFLGIGGTSAGSINALLVAALGSPAEAKSPKLLSQLANKVFF
jgi:Predicted esterase of the alpha-beta hydrolase superfamily